MVQASDNYAQVYAVERQSTLSQESNMSAVPSSQDAIDTPLVTMAPLDACVEGDWAHYRQRSGEILQSALDNEARLQTRRTLALSYLGRRAQWHGGVFSSTQPTVLTPARIASMSESNTARRQQRYPWLAQMLSIVAELDREQHSQMRLSGTVLSFPTSTPGNRRFEFQAG